MSVFKVKPQSIRVTSQGMNEIANEMRYLESEIVNIQNNLSFEIAQKQRIRQRLKTVRNNTVSHYTKIYSLTSTLNNIANTYETTEHRLIDAKAPALGMVFDHSFDNIHDVISFGPGGGQGGGGGAIGGRGGISPTVPPFIGPGALISKFLGLAYENVKGETKYGKGSIKLESMARDHKTSWYDKDKEQLKDSKINTFKVLDQKWSSEGSVIHVGGTVGDKDGSHLSAEADILKGEAYAELYGGLYYTDPKSGEKKLRMSFGGACGATVTAFSTAAEAVLGNSDFGVYGKASADVGRAEAKVDAVVGLRDAEGNLNPTAHVEASAEAIAAEVSGKVGGKILGADVGVKGSLNIGVGAHFEAGLKDGKFSMDVGASLGIGGSVKLEVDIGGAVKAVSGYAKSAWNNLTGWFNK